MFEDLGGHDDNPSGGAMMNPTDLQAFLTSVRKANFIDYLDPMGETAQQALDRRIKWANRNQRDPSHGDEAEFLLRNTDALRQVVLDELLNDDEGWVEEADAGTGWGQPTPYGSSRREDKITSLDMADLPATDAGTDEDPSSGGIMRMDDVSVPPATTRTETPDELPEDLVRDIWNKNAPDGSPPAEEEWPEQDTDPKASPAGVDSDVPEIDVAAVEIPAVRGASVGFSAEKRDEGDSSWAHGWNDTPAPAQRSEEPPPSEDAKWVTHEENEPEPTPLPAPRSAPALIATPPSLEVPKPKTALSIRASQNRPKAAPLPSGSRSGLLIVVILLLVSAAGGAAWWLLAGPGAAAPELTATDPKPAPEEPAPAPEPEPVPEPDEIPEPEPADAGDDDDVALAATPAPAPAPRPTPASAPVAAPAPAPAPAPQPKPVAAPAPQPEPEPDAPEAPPMLTGSWAGIAANQNFELTIESQIARSFSGQAQLMNDSGEYESFSILGKVEVGGAFSFSQKGGGAQFKGQAKGVRLSGTVTLADGTAGKFSLIGS
jgi:hypothetical protein